MGQWFASFLLKDGKEVVIAGRNEGKLLEVKRRLGVEVATPIEAVKDADVILISVPIDNFESVVEQIQPYIRPDQVVIDDTTPRVLNASGVLGLDTVFNGLLDTGDLHYGDGEYRVYAALCDPYGDVLVTGDSALEAWWTFELDLV